LLVKRILNVIKMHGVTIKTLISCSIAFFFRKSVVYEVMGKNILKPERSLMTTTHSCISWLIPKATNTYLGCVILIAFPLQQWIRERVSVLCSTFFACLANFSNRWRRVAVYRVLKDVGTCSLFAPRPI
jgi:hypothetical protein